MIEELLQERLRTGPISLGELVIRQVESASYLIRHWQDDQPERKLTVKTEAIAALDIVRYDELGNYRPLKGAPNLRAGWELRLDSIAEVREAIDYFYPGAFATWLAYNRSEVTPVDLRQTLTRQTGMYRVTQKLSGSQAEELAGRFCCSRSGCLRTILWTIDGKVPQRFLPRAKFDPQTDQLREHLQANAEDERAEAGPYRIPILCVEACNLLVAEARKIVKVHSK
jgi:4Fe-4S iron-sulfur cluster binding domain/DR2241 stabilising domain